MGMSPDNPDVSQTPLRPDSTAQYKLEKESLEPATSEITFASKVMTGFMAFAKFRHFSHYTIKSYLGDITIHFLPYVEECVTKGLMPDPRIVEAGRNPDDLLLTSVPKSLIDAFPAHLYRRGFDENSSARACATVRTLYKWMSNAQMIESNRALDLKPPKKVVAEIRFATPAEVSILTSQEEDYISRRMSLAFDLVFETGHNMSDILGLTRSNIHSPDKQKQLPYRVEIGFRQFNISQALGLKIGEFNELTDFYLENRSVSYSNSIPLFVNKFGDQISERSHRRSLARAITLFELPSDIDSMMIKNAGLLEICRKYGTGKDVENYYKISFHTFRAIIGRLQLRAK